MRTILVTGSEGLIGYSISNLLSAAGYRVIGLDLKDPTLDIGVQGNILSADLVNRMVSESDGVIHLAAVSRVIDGQKNPALCYETNVVGTDTIIQAVRASSRKPWLIYASSREVYGEPTQLPVTEDHQLAPINTYGHSKLAAENLVMAHNAAGGCTSILRFANVHGDILRDHRTRVIPAFTRAAALGEILRVEGSENTFDFTNLDDTCRGIALVVEKLESEHTSLYPIHFLTGQPTTLGELAQMAVKYGLSSSAVQEFPARNYDVSHFYGSYERAKSLLGWEPRHSLENTIRKMVKDWQLLTPESAGKSLPETELVGSTQQDPAHL
jgi:nucleoside-diphosphate-sugar epimerase